MIIPEDDFVSEVVLDTVIPSTTAERWLKAAKTDYRLCCEFARQYGARLPRTLRSQRVGWEVFGHPHCALLLPDATPAECLHDDEWYLYYVSGESVFRRTRAQREKTGMIVLAECADDWAEILRQSLQERVFDLRYQVTPDYVNALGDIEYTRSGYLFAMEAYAPEAAVKEPCRIAGAGATPEEAARTACRQWLQKQDEEAHTGSGIQTCH